MTDEEKTLSERVRLIEEKLDLHVKDTEELGSYIETVQEVVVRLERLIDNEIVGRMRSPKGSMGEVVELLEKVLERIG
jgi:hypothetical protein